MIVDMSQTEQTSEPMMRFFTPQLYVRFNSLDDEAADRANEAWEQAAREYHRHLNAIRQRMPSQVRQLAELCLHDAEVLGFERDLSFCPEPFWLGPLWSTTAILSLKQDEMIRGLIYMLWDHVRERAADESWPFSKSRKHWLYDEIDIADHRGMFLHRILFSDGSVVEIPFASVIINTITLSATDNGGAAKGAALTTA